MKEKEKEEVIKLFKRMVKAKTKQKMEEIADQILKNYLPVEVHVPLKVSSLPAEKKIFFSPAEKDAFHRVSIKAGIDDQYLTVWLRIDSPKDKKKLIKLAEDVEEIKDRISTRENFKKTIEKVLPAVKKSISFTQRDVNKSFIKYFLGGKVKVDHIDTLAKVSVYDSMLSGKSYKKPTRLNVGTIFDILTVDGIVFNKNGKEIDSEGFSRHVVLLFKPNGSVSVLEKNKRFNPLTNKLEDVVDLLNYVLHLYNGIVDPDAIESFLFKYLPKKFNFRIESADDISYEEFAKAKYDYRIIATAKPGSAPQYFIIKGGNLTLKQLKAFKRAVDVFNAFNEKVFLMQRFPNNICM